MSDRRAEVGIVLGTGLGRLAEQVEVRETIAYEDIPGMPVPSVFSHDASLLLGRLEGRDVAVMQGRPHLYEGFTAGDVAHPVRVLHGLGVRTLLLSGACGGMHPLWAPGDLVLLDDHINLQGPGPLVGPNDDELGPRFPDMSEPYDRGLQKLAMAAARERGIVLRRGVYAGVVGPQLETRAEYRMLRLLGADVVGMSTVMEVIAARHLGMRVLAVAIITDQCLPDALEPVDVPEILAIAGRAEPGLVEIFRAVLRAV